MTSRKAWIPWQVLFLFGLGLIYLILAAQFRSYFQPLIILMTVPLAFTGVVLGLLVSGNPLSLYTLYGVVALTGIAVNAAIVLISAANERLAAGMGLEHAVVHAARRRVVPILITTVTTIGGLFSLAIGLGGKAHVGPGGRQHRLGPGLLGAAHPVRHPAGVAHGHGTGSDTRTPPGAIPSYL
jgi:multidrug efflux pump subunit AcrB